MNQDQVDSIVRKVLAVAGGLVAAHGFPAAGTALNTPDVLQLVAGVVMLVVPFISSHMSNATPPIDSVTVKPTDKTVTTTTVAPANK